MIGFELPYFDIDNREFSKELSDSIQERYLNCYDVLKNDLEFFELSNSNILIGFTLVVMVDNNSITKRELDLEWKKLYEDLSSYIDDFITKTSNSKVKLQRQINYASDELI